MGTLCDASWYTRDTDIVMVTGVLAVVVMLQHQTLPDVEIAILPSVWVCVCVCVCFCVCLCVCACMPNYMNINGHKFNAHRYTSRTLHIQNKLRHSDDGISFIISIKTLSGVKIKSCLPVFIIYAFCSSCCPECISWIDGEDVSLIGRYLSSYFIFTRPLLTDSHPGSSKLTRGLT